MTRISLREKPDAKTLKLPVTSHQPQILHLRLRCKHAVRWFPVNFQIASGAHFWRRIAEAARKDRPSQEISASLPLVGRD